MNKQKRNKLRELAGKAELYPDQKNKKWVGSYRIHVEGRTQKVVSHGVYDDESYPYCCLGSGASPEITEYIAAANPDVILQLLNKLDAADELADSIDHVLNSEPGFEDWDWINKAAKAYRKAGESEGDE